MKRGDDDGSWTLTALVLPSSRGVERDTVVEGVRGLECGGSLQWMKPGAKLHDKGARQYTVCQREEKKKKKKKKKNKGSRG